MKAVILEGLRKLRMGEIEIDERMGTEDVRIAIDTVGICGSDLHYYELGRIGTFVVTSPMILGHEASGTIIETGKEVTSLRQGDRVCMEPGVPDPNSKAARLGMYNLDPDIRFWGSPPFHGCLRQTVVHPAAFTYKLPETVSYAEGALIEPMAVGVQASNKARIRNGDVAAVVGAGTIGILAALAALSGGCSKIIMIDIVNEKLEFCKQYKNVVTVNAREAEVNKSILSETDHWGADIVFEASGCEEGIRTAFEAVCPGGCVVQIGCPPLPVSFVVSTPQAKEVRVEFVYRYAHVFPRAIQLVNSGKIVVKPLITNTFPFERGVQAFEFASSRNPASIKTQITFH